MADMARVEEILRKYPSLFVSLQAAGIDSELISLEKLQNEEYEDINLDESRTQNVISYAYFVKGDKKTAYEKNDMVLRQHPGNVIALSNKAWFLFNDNKFQEAEQVCQEIERAEYVEMLVARGELAFAYSRFGLKTYDLAVKEYEELLEERKRGGVPEKYFCMWSFSLFLLLSRQRKDNKSSTESDSFSEKRRLQILRDATQIFPRDDTVKLYQALCYAYICKIRYSQVCIQFTAQERYTQLRLEPLHAIDKAYELGYNSVHTLNLIGRYMRYYNERLKECISCLKRSNELRETSKGFQRLALAQKRVLEFRKKPEQNIRIIKIMKCPRKPFVSLSKYKQHPQMEEVLENLDKAVALDPKNMSAFYDFGLTYRQIDEYKMALEKFEHILNFPESTRTRMQLQITNAYEQSGFCIADMCETGNVPPAGRTRLENKMRSAFKKSVELSCSYVKMVPTLVHIWTTTPTLNQLLIGDVRTSKEVKELLFLDERLKKQSALEIIEKLRCIDGHLEHNDRRIQDLIRQLIDAETYDDAILTMELITCLPNGYDALDDDTYTDIYIRGGLEAYMCGEAFLGRLRIGNALTFRKYKSQQRAGAVENKILDEDIANVQGTEMILIYQNECLTDASDRLLSVFKEVGVKITVYPPSKEIVYGADNTVIRNYLTLVGGNVSVPEDRANMEESTGNLAINNFDTNVDLIFKDFDKRTYGNVLVVKLEADTEVPDRLQGFLAVTFRAEKNREIGSLDKEDRDFVVSSLKGMANIRT